MKLHFHKWTFHQIYISADNGSCSGMVIAWKVCDVCAKSKLIHILPS